jgi:hypothetical protein
VQRRWLIVHEQYLLIHETGLFSYHSIRDASSWVIRSASEYVSLVGRDGTPVPFLTFCVCVRSDFTLFVVTKVLLVLRTRGALVAVIAHDGEERTRW